jgi:hypothetical protein
LNKKKTTTSYHYALEGTEIPANKPMSNPNRRNLVNFIIVLTFARKKQTRVGVSKKSDEEMRRIFLLFSFSLLERMGDNSGANQNFTNSRPQRTNKNKRGCGVVVNK